MFYPNRCWNNECRARFLMSPYPLTNFKLQRYYQNESQFNSVYSQGSLSSCKSSAASKIHRRALYVNENN